jgi:hypothetical protein
MKIKRGKSEETEFGENNLDEEDGDFLYELDLDE